METLIPLTVGLLIAVGLYLIQSRSAFMLAIGILVLGHAVNLLLFTAGGFVRGSPPILAENGARQAMADPLVQALILTAIVIGLGLQSFVVALVYRLNRLAETLDLADEDLSEEEDAAEGTP